MKDYSYSLIIPHKNSPNLLQRLLDSIPERDDLQILIIDDCSDVAILGNSKLPGYDRADTEIYMLKDSRGAGYCRNIGIQHSLGKWILFSDADDCYTENFNDILDKYKFDDIHDLIILNAIKRKADDTIIENFDLNMYVRNYLNKRWYSDRVIKYGFWTPWSRMVKRSLIFDNNLKFEEIPVGNDMMFCLNCSKYSRNYAVEETPFYIYYQPDNRSVTSSYRNSLEAQKSIFELNMRAQQLHKSVNYLFKTSLVIQFFIMPKGLNAKKSEYRALIRKLMKDNKRSYISEIYYLLIWFVGRKLRII